MPQWRHVDVHLNSSHWLGGFGRCVCTRDVGVSDGRLLDAVVGGVTVFWLFGNYSHVV